MIEDFLHQASGWVWGPVLIAFLIGTGIYFTVLLKGIQIRKLGAAFKAVFTRQEGGAGDISPFQALSTALAANVGTGNIAGVATAVTLGGVGALFWMWIGALVGMALTYAECLLAVRFRQVNDQGEMAGGPMYTIENGLGKNWKWLAVCFAIFAVLASLGIGNLVQAHSVGDVLHATLQIPRGFTAVVLSIVIAIVIFGGIKRIGALAGILVPAMALFYMVGGIVIIIMRIDQLPSALGLIFESAFTGQAATGAFLGSSWILALRYGVSRGLFSNEAGMGSNAIAAAAATTDQPARQGLINMTGTFLDTLVVCTVTGLVIAVTGVLGTPDLDGAPLAVFAFGSVFPGGGYIVALGLILFAYTTLVAWAYYGEKALEYLVGRRGRWIYRICFAIIVFFGVLAPLQAVWNFADIANGLMAFTNLIALIALAGVVYSETRLFEK